MIVKTNSFQAVLVTDGERSFVFFSYGVIQWSERANIGFDSDSSYFMLSGALTPASQDIEESSNVGEPGLFVHRVDQENILHPTQQLCQGNAGIVT
jgi:hypothetical protein